MRAIGPDPLYRGYISSSPAIRDTNTRSRRQVPANTTQDESYYSWDCAICSSSQLDKTSGRVRSNTGRSTHPGKRVITRRYLILSPSKSQFYSPSPSRVLGSLRYRIVYLISILQCLPLLVLPSRFIRTLRFASQPLNPCDAVSVRQNFAYVLEFRDVGSLKFDRV